jgi:acyl carrier protein
MPVDAVRGWFASPLRSVPLLNAYGPTETTITASLHRVSEADAGRQGRIPIGRPLGGRVMYILDRHGELMPVGLVGELFIGGACVARGYLNHPELTEGRFVVNPFQPLTDSRLYRSGDRARYLADGTIDFLGRNDDQVKIRGYRIELGEIETALAEHPGVAGAAALVREVTPGDRRIVAYVVLRPQAEVTDGELRGHLRQILPEYMVPSVIAPVSVLPLTPTGKVDRKALSGMAAPVEQEVVAPRNPVEAAIARVWAQVLNRPRVGIDQSFFDLGGHSLLATQVVGRLSKLFRMKIPLRTLFTAQTVVALAEALVALEPKPGQVATIARILQQIEEMPEEERRARTERAASSEPVRT